MNIKQLILTTAMFLLSLCGASQIPTFTRLESGDIVFCLFSDSSSMVWAGTQYGLARFDGQSFVHTSFYLPEPSPHDMRINCAQKDGTETILTGTSCGLFLINLRTMYGEKISVFGDMDIRSVTGISDSDYLIGTTEGLFVFNRQNSSLTKTSVSSMCYNAVPLDSEHVLVCTYTGAYLYDTARSEISRLDALPDHSDGVLAAASDRKRNCIWIGTNGSLFKCSVDGQECRDVDVPQNAYKTILLDSNGLLLCGTENGLVIYDPDTGRRQSAKRRSRDFSSLSGNVIWALMEDEWHNVWIGTNKGISVWQRNSSVTIYDWDYLTEGEEDNNINSLAFDRNGNLWAGGDAGAVQFESIPPYRLLAWYRTDNPSKPLTKDTVRKITVDDEGDLWLGTDDGINLFDPSSRQFRNYIIHNGDRSVSGHWVYDISDDHRGNLWISTFENGIFVVEKGKIKSSAAGYVAASAWFSNTNGKIPDNTVARAQCDSDGNMWILLTRVGVMKYNVTENSSRLFTPDYFSSADPLRNMLVCGDKVWLGSIGGLYCLDTKKLEYRYIPMPEMDYANPVLQTGRVLWVIDRDRVVMVDTMDFSTKERILGRSGFTCGAAGLNGEILLAGKGQIACLPVDFRDKQQEQVVPTLFVTNLRFNGSPAEIKENPDNLKDITLPFGKDFEIDVASGFFRDEFTNIEYSLVGVTSWTRMRKACQSISLPGLRPGRYHLVFRSVPDKITLKEIKLRVQHPWYTRWHMILIYLILAAWLLYMGISLLSTKYNLRIVRDENEQLRDKAEKGRKQLETIRQLTEPDESSEPADQVFMRNLTDFIERNISNEKLSVNDISEYMKMPQKQLYRKVKGITGFPIVEFVRNMRLKKAASYLKTGDYTISEVIYKVGFNNLSYFSKCFKELFGMSPKSYIEK